MEPFAYRAHELSCESVSPRALADAVGTPAYVYSSATLLDRYRVYDRAFADLTHVICYAVKANANLAVISTLARAGAGADIVSGGELYRALRAGMPPRSIIFLGVGKTRDEMREALKAIMGAGAYGFAMAPNYNARPRAAEVLVQGDPYTIVRRRETSEHLVAGETTA